nr:unnamed protein product [Digitaria exilis]
MKERTYTWFAGLCQCWCYIAGRRRLLPNECGIADTQGYLDLQPVRFLRFPVKPPRTAVIGGRRFPFPPSPVVRFSPAQPSPVVRFSSPSLYLADEWAHLVSVVFLALDRARLDLGFPLAQGDRRPTPLSPSTQTAASVHLATAAIRAFEFVDQLRAKVWNPPSLQSLSLSLSRVLEATHLPMDLPPPAHEENANQGRLLHERADMDRIVHQARGEMDSKLKLERENMLGRVKLQRRVLDQKLQHHRASMDKMLCEERENMDQMLKLERESMDRRFQQEREEMDRTIKMDRLSMDAEIMQERAQMDMKVLEERQEMDLKILLEDERMKNASHG